MRTVVPLPTVADDLDGPVVFLNDAAANRQPEPRPFPFFLGGEEGLHDLLQVLGRNAHAGVRELDQHAGLAVASVAGAVRRVSVPPCGMASPALVSRFRKTCRNFCRSA